MIITFNFPSVWWLQARCRRNFRSSDTYCNVSYQFTERFSDTLGCITILQHVYRMTHGTMCAHNHKGFMHHNRFRRTTFHKKCVLSTRLRNIPIAKHQRFLMILNDYSRFLTIVIISWFNLVRIMLAMRRLSFNIHGYAHMYGSSLEFLNPLTGSA